MSTDTEQTAATDSRQRHAELTVVLPCLNEAETLATCIRKARASIQQLGIAGEVVVADNGSTDGSREIAAAEGARVVPIPTRGYGAALQGGIAAARGEYVIMADADDSYALEDLGPFVDELRRGADVVMGNRFEGGIAPGAMPFLHRWLGNPVLSFLGRLFFKVPVGDFHCGMRGFRRDRILALGLRTPGMEFASEMVVRASLAHLDIREVPTTLRPDGRSRAPHLRTWRDGWRHLTFLLAFSPKWLLLYPALVLLLVGLVGLVSLATGPLRLGSIALDVHTMLAAAAAVIVGAQGATLYVVSRAYAATIGLLPAAKQGVEGWVDRLTLEHGLVAGAASMVAGIVCFVVAFLHWESLNFGDLDVVSSLRLPIIGVVLMVVGAQAILASFMLSLTRFADQAVTAEA